MGVHHVGQGGLELMDSSDPPTLAGITAPGPYNQFEMCHKS